jgi:hypothetical protein
MSKAIGILLILGLVWVGIEVYTEGTAGAFGGLFAGVGESAAAGGPVTQRAARKWVRAHEEGEDRVDRALSRKGESE